jgi:polysaccharide biosynthesis protein PslG
MAKLTSISVALLALALILVAAPAAGASQSGDTEHGVSRARLASKAMTVIEERNGIDVLRISKCGPHKRKGKLDFSRWTCLWRAAGEYPGTVPYSCAGKAVWARKNNSWRVDKCVNQRQPEAPLLDQPNPQPAFGFNDDWPNFPNAALDLAESAHPTVIRVGLDWQGVQGGGPDSYSWTNLDQLYQRLRDRGLRPLWAIFDAPCWAQPDPGGCRNGDNQFHPSPQYDDEMAKFAVAAVKRYPTSYAVEVWNEPNYPKFWGGWPNADQYAEMFSTVADALHAQVPGLPVITGGLSPHSDSDQNAVGFRNFLISLYEDGAAQKADAIGVHPYPGVGPNADYLADVRVYLGKIQNVMGRYGDAQKPMWVTEYGVSTAGPDAFSEQGQADALVALYDMFRHIQSLPVVIVHRLVEAPLLPGREAGFGLVSQNLAPKPALCSLLGVAVAPNSLC